MASTTLNLFSTILLLSILTNSSAVDVLRINQTIKDGDTIVSANSEFELGFFSRGSSTNRYVGIWFKKISYGTIVWVANRDTPLNNTAGMLRIDNKAILLFANASNTVIWSSNSSTFVNNPVAQLLDTGNLVFRDEQDGGPGNFVWQSFDYPGNTMLPGMKFGTDLVTGKQWYCSSWKSVDDPSSGSYIHRMDTHGYPQLLLWKGSELQGTTGTGSTMATTSSVVPTIDSNHPYFIQNSDNPGIPLVTQLLTEQNYHQWSRSISIALSAKMKLGMIDGSLVKPSSDSPHYAMWIRCNDMVVSWLLNSISTEIRNSVAFFSTAKQIWEDLAIRFSQTNLPRIFQLRKDLASMHQGNMSITSYFTKYRTLMSEIDTLSPIPKCVCVNNNCSCENAMKLEKYEDMVKLSQFLMGLGDQYTAVRGQLLMMRPTPSLNHAFSLLLQEESQREFSVNMPPVTENMAMNVRFNNKARNFTQNTSLQKRITNDPNLLCDYCQSTGHPKEKCFYLHGYPEWHKMYGKPKPKLKRIMNSGFKTAQISVKNNSADIVKDHHVTGENIKDNNFTLSDAQCQQIVRMLQDKISPATNWTATSSNSQLSGPYPDEGERDW